MDSTYPVVFWILLAYLFGFAQGLRTGANNTVKKKSLEEPDDDPT